MRWCRGSVAPSSFPPPSPWSGTPFPPRGPLGCVPPLPQYYGVLRLLLVRPTAFRCLHAAVPRRHSCCAPVDREWSVRDAWAVQSGALPIRWRGDEQVSQVPGGTPRCTCPALRPRRALHARPALGVSTRPSVLPNDVGARDGLSVEAPSRGLHTPCVRFAGRITQPSVPAGGHPLPDGIVYPLGPTKGFRDVILGLHLFPLLQASPGALGTTTLGRFTERTYCDVGHFHFVLTRGSPLPP